MKKCFAIVCTAMAMRMTASAQNPKLNPLNYSGKMYISAVEMLTTPRYVSYEEHAILSSEMTVPVMEVTVAQFDFEKKIVVIDGKEAKIGKTYVKEYSSDYYNTFVIYMEPAGEGDCMELVWPEKGNPYLLQITPGESGVAICKMQLSHKPVATSGEDALMQLLNSLGGF
jgi:hypothetical protein